jgi:hypothetical protein
MPWPCRRHDSWTAFTRPPIKGRNPPRARPPEHRRWHHGCRQHRAPVPTSFPSHPATQASSLGPSRASTPSCWPGRTTPSLAQSSQRPPLPAAAPAAVPVYPNPGNRALGESRSHPHPFEASPAACLVGIRRPSPPAEPEDHIARSQKLQGALPRVWLWAFKSSKGLIANRSSLHCVFWLRIVKFIEIRRKS